MELFTHSWLPFIYLYGIGGLFFMLGMVIIRKSGALDLGKPSHRRWWKILYFGFFWFAAIHAVLTLLALS